MLELNKNDGITRAFEGNTELCSYLMAMENEKLLGCDLYLVREQDLPGGGIPAGHLPAVIQSGDGACCLVVNTREGIKRISDPTEIGIGREDLTALFEENLPKGKAYLYWDDPMLKAITVNGGHNKFWGDAFKGPWSFLVLTPNRIAALLSTLNKPCNQEMLQEAWERQLTIVDVCKGDFKGVKQVVVQSAAQIEALQQEWCTDYCAAHGLSVKECAA